MQNTQAQIDTPLCVLGPFKQADRYYFRIVWPKESHVVTSKSFAVANRLSNLLQRKIAETSR